MLRAENVNLTLLSFSKFMTIVTGLYFNPLGMDPHRVLPSSLHSFVDSGRAGVPYRPAALPVLGLSEVDKQCIRDHSCIMARHIFADKGEENISALVNTLLHPWVNEFSKLHVQDWAQEFGHQVSEGLSGKSSANNWADAYDKYLDPPFNNLTGKIPDLLAVISSLQVLNLSGNQFAEPVPDALRKNPEKKLHVLRIDGQNPCLDGNICDSGDKKKIIAPLTVITSIVAVVLLLLVVLTVFITRRRQQGFASGTSPSPCSEDYAEQRMDSEDYQVKLESLHFTLWTS